ncbi:hypothetical protein MPH_04966 [Macrophomina phaseolina MS6]|uniref:Uncharacterized protein n=1 Tax=Macrophomina phaseolina (strain MS6) TaxID=1126212 RepID=K2RYJ2_MACPH|nr:hypothetical protein MPH_04966 [Macrophomina phaseolina MS6]
MLVRQVDIDMVSQCPRVHGPLSQLPHQRAPTGPRMSSLENEDTGIGEIDCQGCMKGVPRLDVTIAWTRAVLRPDTHPAHLVCTGAKWYDKTPVNERRISEAFSTWHSSFLRSWRIHLPWDHLAVTSHICSSVSERTADPIRWTEEHIAARDMGALGHTCGCVE